MKKYKKYFIITLMLAFVFSFSFTSLPVSAASKYGTYGRRTYYYTVSKAKNIRIEKRGKAVGKYLNEWMEGGVKLAVSYAMGNYSIPFSIVEIMVGDGGVKYDKKSYSSYVFQAKYTTRNIFYYQDNAKKKKKVVLSDEKGVADVFYEFHPVGVGFKESTYTKKLKSKATVKTTYYDKKSRNLERCNILANHNTKEMWTISSELLTEKWRKK